MTVDPATPARLAETQLAILRSAAAVLRPGGVLVYSTCTLLPEENENVVRKFLQDSPAFALAERDAMPDEVRSVVDEEGFLRCLPHVHDADGFFAARLERQS